MITLLACVAEVYSSLAKATRDQCIIKSDAWDEKIAFLGEENS